MARWPLFLAAALVATLVFNLKAVYILFWTLLLLHVAGGWALRRAVESLRVQPHSPSTHLFPDETAAVRLRIENLSRLPITWLYARLWAPAEFGRKGEGQWVLSLGPRAAETIAYAVKGARRGVYTLGPLEVVAGDAFGLQQRARTIDTYHDVVVFPVIYSMEELGLPSNLLSGKERVRRPLQPDPTRLIGIRRYEPGDPRRWIHWKATARTGELHVKQFEHTLSGESLLLVNLNSEEYPAATWVNESELAIATAASLAHRLAEGRERFAFATNARLVRHRSAKALERVPTVLEEGERGVVRIPPRHGQAQLIRVLQVLAAAACKPGPSFAQVIEEAAADLAWGSAVLMVVPSVTEAVRERALRLKASGHRVAIFLTGAKAAGLPGGERTGVRTWRVEYTAAGRLRLSAAAE